MAKTGKPRGRPRKVQIVAADPANKLITVPFIEADEPVEKEQDIPQIRVPADWRTGMLLNVRNTGPDYTITLWPEEYDYRKPERALKFTNPGECQNFVSKWYQRESHDPRAL